MRRVTGGAGDGALVVDHAYRHAAAAEASHDRETGEVSAENDGADLSSATALVESDSIGEGTAIWAFSHVLKSASVGKRCNIGDHCFIEKGAAIGDDVTIKNGNVIGDGITIERGAFIGPGVAFTNDVYPRFLRLEQARNKYRGRDRLARTVVGERATLGTGAIVVAGLAIGAYALVGAGAVVTRHVPAFALVVGNPARRRGWVCVCGSRLNFHRGRAVCGSCGLEFRQTDTGVESASAAAGPDA